MLLENKVIVVTGGSAGLGEQICYEAARRGAIVVICARRSQLINKVKEHCMTLSGKPAYAFQLILQTLKVSKISLLRFVKRSEKWTFLSTMLVLVFFKNLQK